jgi:hypothetical protein
MLVGDPPSTRQTPPPDALIREARRRQRRRWVLIAAVLVAVGGGVAVVAARGGGTPAVHERGRPVPSTVPPPPRPAPSLDGLTAPSKLAVALDGSLLIADQGTYQIKQRSADGALRVVAGTGTPGYSGDGGPATSAEIGWPADLEMAPDGTIYFTDFVGDVSTSRLRAIRPDGTIITVSDVVGAGGLAITPDGSVWTAGSGGISRVTPDGASESVLPGGPNGLQLPSGETYLWPRDLAFDAAGNLYFSNHSPPMVVELSPALEVIATWEGGRSYGGMVGTRTGVVLDAGGGTVYEIDRGTMKLHFDLTKLRGVSPFRTSGLARGPHGEIYVDQRGSGGWDAGFPLLVEIEPDGNARMLGTHPI